MFPTNNIAIFIKKNHSEFQNLVYHICDSVGYLDPPSDVIQGLYYKFLTSKIIQAYNPDFNGSSIKISTYLYPIIRNFILSKQHSFEYRRQYNYSFDYNDDLYNHEASNYDVDDIDLIIRHNPIAIPFQNILLNNQDDYNEGLNRDLKDFTRLFPQSKSNKRYPIKKGRSECTLFNIFQYLYDGYNNREIAEIYGISPMYVTYMKQTLAEIMIKHGFHYSLNYA